MSPDAAIPDSGGTSPRTADAKEDATALDKLRKAARKYTFDVRRHQFGEAITRVEVGQDKVDLDMEKFMNLKSVFGKSLTEEEFSNRFEPIFRGSLTKEQLRLWFTRIDVNDNGYITWEGFSTFLLLEHSDNDKNTKVQLFEPWGHSESNPRAYHKGMVTKILAHHKNNTYYTTCDDGSVSVWDHNLLHLGPLPYHSGAMISDAFFDKNQAYLYTSHVDRVINCYSVNEKRITRRYIGCVQGVKRATKGRKGIVEEPGWKRFDTRKPPETVALADLLDPPSTMDGMKFDERDHIVLGLRHGGLQLYNIVKQQQSIAGKDVLQRGDIMPALSPVMKWPGLHRDCISKVRWCEFLRSFITTSWDTRIKLVNPEDGQVRMVGDLHHGHDRSIFSFSWCQSLKVLATCGGDQEIFIWNPWISRPIFKFPAGNCTQVDVAFNEQDLQLISMGADKTIRIYDMRTYKLLQTIYEGKTLAPEDVYSAMLFNSQKNTLVTASSYPRGYTYTPALDASSQPAAPAAASSGQAGDGAVGNPGPPLLANRVRGDILIACLYNTHFQQMLIVDMHTVTVWDVTTGKKLSSFSVYDNTITAATFDSTSRRLILGTLGGGLLEYNHINGQVLKRLVAKKGGGTPEVTKCTYVSKPELNGMRYYYACADRNINIWPDKEEVSTEPISSMRSTGGDINCSCFCSPGIFAIGTSLGVITIYNVKTMRRMYHMGREVLACKKGRLSRANLNRDDPVPGIQFRRSSKVLDMLSDDSDVDSDATDSNDEQEMRDFSILQRLDLQQLDLKPVESLAWMARKHLLVSVMGDKYIHFFLPEKGELVKSYNTQTTASSCRLFNIAANVSSDVLAASDDDGCIHVFDVDSINANPQAIASSNIVPVVKFHAHSSTIVSIMFCEGINTIASSCSLACKLFTLEGICIGVFGPDRWHLGSLQSWNTEMIMSPDKQSQETAGTSHSPRTTLTKSLYSPDQLREGMSLLSMVSQTDGRITSFRFSENELELSDLELDDSSIKITQPVVDLENKEGAAEPDDSEQEVKSRLDKRGSINASESPATSSVTSPVTPKRRVSVEPLSRALVDSTTAILLDEIPQESAVPLIRVDSLASRYNVRSPRSNLSKNFKIRKIAKFMPKPHHVKAVKKVHKVITPNTIFPKLEEGALEKSMNEKPRARMSTNCSQQIYLDGNDWRAKYAKANAKNAIAKMVKDEEASLKRAQANTYQHIQKPVPPYLFDHQKHQVFSSPNVFKAPDLHSRIKDLFNKMDQERSPRTGESADWEGMMSGANSSIGNISNIANETDPTLPKIQDAGSPQSQGQAEQGPSHAKWIQNVAGRIANCVDPRSKLYGPTRLMLMMTNDNDGDGGPYKMDDMVTTRILKGMYKKDRKFLMQEEMTAELAQGLDGV